MRLLSKNKQTRLTRPESGRRAPATTYYRRGSQKGERGRSPFQKKPVPKNRRKYLLGVADVILAGLLLFGLGYSLAISPHAKVLVNSQAFHPLHDYETAADNQLRAVKNRNKLTFDEKGLVEALQKQFPEISGASVELPLFSEKPTIRLAIASPSFKLDSQGTDYIVSTQGVIVAKASSLPGVKSLTTVNDQSGFSASVGKRVLSSDDVRFINTLISQSLHAKVPISSLVLPAAPQELDLRTSDQGYYVKFYLGGDVLNETGQFLAARRQFIKTKQPPSSYLDVRVAGKIFYK